jgi:hypothetical protein
MPKPYSLDLRHRVSAYVAARGGGPICRFALVRHSI